VRRQVHVAHDRFVSTKTEILCIRARERPSMVGTSACSPRRGVAAEGPDASSCSTV
jgi:hypothetical protein